jgi:hypothetical protein
VLSAGNVRYRLHQLEKRRAFHATSSCRWRTERIVLYVWCGGRLARRDYLLSILGARRVYRLSILRTWNLLSWKCRLNMHDKVSLWRRLDASCNRWSNEIRPFSVRLRWAVRAMMLLVERLRHWRLEADMFYELVERFLSEGAQLMTGGFKYC